MFDSDIYIAIKNTRASSIAIPILKSMWKYE